MNRFRTKKKVKEPVEGSRKTSIDDGPTLKPSKTFRLGKKTPEPQPKLELDIVNALPSSDDFRTSLLMNGLSARFSMLREQDDPKSKIGKASDDSVLFPSKRQSRGLYEFGFQPKGLSDIAEVSSINGSIRPPFAFARSDSYHTDGYGTDDEASPGGSIMNRSKPGEGNNLFGGRQKIYKIPMGSSSAKNLGGDGASSGMGGRALYGDDVSLSAFQKLRDRERDQKLEQQRQDQDREDAEQNTQTSRPNSPPLSGYNRNRETSSTTSSASQSNIRTSTAATSVTSQRTPSLSGPHAPPPNGVAPNTNGIERSTTKTRRLYETGLDQHLHEQQFSAMSRIDILTRQRVLGAQTPPLGLSPTGTTNPVDRWDRNQITGKASMPNMRAASPPPPTTHTPATFDFGVKLANAPEPKALFGIASPPLSPPMSESDEHATLAVQPNDRGKATALGAFSKPAQPYDENKYSQRQLQMQQGRETPPLRKNSPPRAYQPRQQPMNRARGDSNATYASNRSRSNSSAQRQYLPYDRTPEGRAASPQIVLAENKAIGKGAFLSSPSGSSVGSPADPETQSGGRWGPSKPFNFPSMSNQERLPTPERPPESQHPANRLQPFQPHEPIRGLNGSNSPVRAKPQAGPSHIAEPLDPGDFLDPETAPPADSPTLPTSGLSGMVRQHLRSTSNTSSIYGGAPSAGLLSRFPSDPVEPTMPCNDYSTGHNPWESEDWDQEFTAENKMSFEVGVDELQTETDMPPPLPAQPPDADGVERDPPISSWEKEMDSRHTRDGSSETQKERQDFHMELAARRRRVQENLKSFVETDSRSTSPLPGENGQRDNQVKNSPLDILRTRSSRSSLIAKPKESKAMKMLGIGNATISSSHSPGKSKFDEKAWKAEEEETMSDIKPATIAPQTKAFRQARREAQRDRERQLALRHQRRMDPESGSMENTSQRQSPNPDRRQGPTRDRVPPNIQTRHHNPSRERGPPYSTHAPRNGSGQESQGSVTSNQSESRPGSRATRDRSSSDTSGRSKSRNGRYRDDLAKAMAEGTSSSSLGVYEDSQTPRLVPKSPAPGNAAFQPSPIPSPMAASNGRLRNNSKPGYLDQQKLAPLQTGDALDMGLSPRPSPVTPYSVNSTPSLTPITPVGSGSVTPTTQGFQSQGRIPTNRKKSVNKSEISEPTLISSTSRITTVNLPPGSSLQNGMESAPPIPPVNPRRRQTRAMFGNFMGKKDSSESIDAPSLLPASQSAEEMSTFSADEGETKPKQRQKLRKSSSEGGNMNARARQVANATPSPALPDAIVPPPSSSPPRHVEGGMF
ncbi:hypothetical protein B7494_g1150 [Chlorociboria aeruginascens]|nr:hypothetical protein B7494_g1150 [Chlorociboria aeruginascens]